MVTNAICLAGLKIDSFHYSSMDSFLSTNIAEPLHTNLSLSTAGNTVRGARYSKKVNLR